jgi:phosphoribosylglycinamide formyltransferase-1
MSKSHIALFASGSGTNAEEIFKYFKASKLIDVTVLLTNNSQAFALERAKNFNVPAYTFTRKQFNDAVYMLDLLTKHQATHIVLAGFLWLVPDYLIKAFPERIINIHPALLPKYGGKGMYGMSVHEAVKASAEKETGITIHEVNEHYDDGTILFQKKCKISKDDSPEDIANKVHQLEHKHYPKVIEKWIKDK